MKSIIVFLVSAFALVIVITLGANYLDNNFATKNSSQNTDKTSDVVTTSPTVPKTTTTKGTTTTPTPKPTPTPTPAPTPTTPSYTLAQVKTHASSSSCWTIVQSTVYDLTPFIRLHPGGSSAILSLCGKDGTTAFENQHGGQRRPANELAGLEIGTYKKL